MPPKSANQQISKLIWLFDIFSIAFFNIPLLPFIYQATFNVYVAKKTQNYKYLFLYLLLCLLFYIVLDSLFWPKKPKPHHSNKPNFCF